MGQLYLSIRTIFILTFFCHLPIVPAHVIENRLLKPLDIDQAYLTIHNQDRSSELSVLSTVVACEHCDFSLLANVTANGNETKIIDTRYPYNFQFFAVQRNENLSCYIESYSFDEHGSYLLEVNRTEQNTTSCGIIQTGDSSYYYTPIIVGVILLFSFIVAIQVTHRLYHSQYARRILTNIGHERLVNRENDSIASFVPNSPRPSDRIDSDILGTIANTPEVPLVASTRSSTNSVRLSRVLPKRLRGLDTFRGFSLMIMIFVNYGGGGYWFFDHSVWNGLTLADLVFPWFVWMMGASIVLSQRSLRTKGVFKLSIFLKICKRTCILFLLGLLLQSGDNDPKTVRILGVLQRLALCYFLTAIIVLWLDPTEEDFNGSTYPIGHDVEQPLRIELQHTILQFWMQWIAIILITTAWLIITFVPSFENCPRGYVGPGGRHEHGNYQNCTGGMAGYIDRKILGAAHLYDEPTCKDVYQTTVPYDPEGILGILTGTVLCYLGVHAAHCFVHSTRIRRVCGQWIISGLVFGTIGLILSKGGHSESWIPINKNLWSLSFILILASLAYFLLTIFYLLVDVYQWFTGEPWLWLGMNSIVVYVGHEVCSDLFPVQFQVENTHAKRLAMNAYGVTLWMIVAGLMYYTKTFVAV